MRLPRVFYATALAAVPLIAVQVAARTNDQARPGWIADSKTGCKIWNPAPQPDESVTWSGACKNGFADGDGTLQWFEHGKPDVRYEGGYRGGKRDGYGVITDPSGNHVTGEWHNDEPVTMGRNEINFIERP